MSRLDDLRAVLAQDYALVYPERKRTPHLYPLYTPNHMSWLPRCQLVLRRGRYRHDWRGDPLKKNFPPRSAPNFEFHKVCRECLNRCLGEHLDLIADIIAAPLSAGEIAVRRDDLTRLLALVQP